METYKYNSTFSLSEYWRIFTSYTNLGFASVCILVNIRQYSLRLQVLLYTYMCIYLLFSGAGTPSPEVSAALTSALWTPQAPPCSKHC